MCSVRYYDLFIPQERPGNSVTVLRRADQSHPKPPNPLASVFMYECRRRFTPHKSSKKQKSTLCRPYVRHRPIVAYVMMVIRLVMMAVRMKKMRKKNEPRWKRGTFPPSPGPKGNPDSSNKKSKL